ncbi:MAG: hypothetical protein AAGK79_17390 [Pseudomonadota bacterium]
MSDQPPEIGSIIREGDEVIIRIPISEVHALRVSLQECPCRAPKSHAPQADSKGEVQA